MTKLNEKIKAALDESRMLILGTQILLGFQFRGVFELIGAATELRINRCRSLSVCSCS